jgi:hypothetical protein
MLNFDYDLRDYEEDNLLNDDENSKENKSSNKETTNDCPKTDIKNES